MEILTKTLTLTLLLFIVASPFFVWRGLKRLQLKYNLFLYMFGGFLVTFTLTVVLAWWAYYANQLLLSHYGYDFEAMNDTDRFENVAATNLDQVSILERNMLGVGWPLKAIMGYAFFSPVLLLLYTCVYIVKRRRRKSKSGDVV